MFYPRPRRLPPRQGSKLRVLHKRSQLIVFLRLWTIRLYSSPRWLKLWGPVQVSKPSPRANSVSPPRHKRPAPTVHLVAYVPIPSAPTQLLAWFTSGASRRMNQSSSSSRRTTMGRMPLSLRTLAKSQSPRHRWRRVSLLTHSATKLSRPPPLRRKETPLPRAQYRCRPLRGLVEASGRHSPLLRTQPTWHSSPRGTC